MAAWQSASSHHLPSIWELLTPRRNSHSNGGYRHSSSGTGNDILPEDMVPGEAPGVMPYPKFMNYNGQGSVVLGLPPNATTTAAQLALPPPSAATSISLTDLEALLVKAVETRQSELVGDGLASIRQSLKGTPDLKTRCGVMGPRKILEINKMLLEEMEESFMWNIGYICSVFHSWWASTVVAKTGKDYDKKLERRKGEWEKCYDEQEANYIAKLEDAAKKSQKDTAKWRFMIEEWATCDDQLVLKSTVRGWYHVTSSIRERKALERRWQMASEGKKQLALNWILIANEGNVNLYFLHWKTEAATTKINRLTEERIKDLLSDELGRREALESDHRLELQRRQDQRKALIKYTLERWEFGDDAALGFTVLRSWRNWCLEAAQLSASRQAVHCALRRFFEGDSAGMVHTCIMQWKLATTHSRAFFDKENAIQDLLNDTRGQREALEADHRSELQRLQDQRAAQVAYAVASWELGDDHALVDKILRTWQNWHTESKRLSASRQAVHSAVLRCIEGDTKGTLHACVINWTRWAKHEWQIREGERRLAEERSRWEKFVEDTSKQHLEELDDVKDEAAIRAENARAATELMLRQWCAGDIQGLVAMIVYEWRRIITVANDNQLRLQTVRSSVLRFCEGEDAGGVHVCLLNWKQYTKVQQVYKNEVAEADREIIKLKERTSALLGKEQQRILTYSKQLGSGVDRVYIMIVFNEWRLGAEGIRAAEERRQTAAQIEELRLKSNIAHTKSQKLASSSLVLLTGEQDSVIKVDAFLEWRLVWLVIKQDKTANIQNHALMTRFSEYTLRSLITSDDSSLCSQIFWEFHCAARKARHEREREELEVAHEVTVQDMKEQKSELEEQLQRAYKHIDELTEKLKNELNTKEGLVKEVADLLKENRNFENRLLAQKEAPRPMPARRSEPTHHQRTTMM